MHWQDAINSAILALCSITLWLNVQRLYRDKQIRGVSWMPTLLFAGWGYWDLYYYPHLGQWFSLVSTISITAANTLWVMMALKYRKN